MGFTHPPTNIEPENRPIVLERSLPTPNSWQGPCWLEHDATVARLETDTTIHCARGENFWNDSRTSPVARWCILQWILQIFTVHIYIYIIYYVRIYIVYIKYIYMYYIRYWHIITIISLDILASSLQRLSQLDPPTKTHNPNPRSYDCHTDLPWHGLNSAIFWVKNAEGLFPWTGL